VNRWRGRGVFVSVSGRQEAGKVTFTIEMILAQSFPYLLHQSRRQLGVRLALNQHFQNGHAALVVLGFAPALDVAGGLDRDGTNLLVLGWQVGKIHQLNAVVMHKPEHNTLRVEVKDTYSREMRRGGRG
jgi:hypothetical protein